MRPNDDFGCRGKAECVGIRVALCLAVVVLLTGCRFPGTVRPTIKIGLVAPFEGRYRYIGYDVIYAVRLALREANSAGGVGTYSVELVAYDDGGDPEMARQQARKLAVDTQVVAVIGHFRDQTTEAAAPIYDESGIPLVAPAVLATSLTHEYPAVFRLGPPASALAQAVVDCQASEPGVTGFSLVAADSFLGSAILLDAESRAIDVEVLPADNELGQRGDTPADVGGTVVVCHAEPLLAAQAAKDLQALGWTGKLVGGPPLLTSDFTSVAGSAADGALVITPWPLPGDVAGSDAFQESYQAMGYHVGAPGPLALPAYEAAWLILEALEQNVGKDGAPSRAGVAAALAGGQRSGQLGLIVFDDQGEWADAPLYWYEIQRGGIPLLVDGLSCTSARQAEGGARSYSAIRL